MLFSFAEYASPQVQMAAPSRTTSLIKNCPTEEESAGKPPRLGSHPGAENRNERVVRNMNTAAALPTADARGNHGRRAINAAMAIYNMPSPVENSRTDRMLYIQPIKGLLATRG